MTRREFLRRAGLLSAGFFLPRKQVVSPNIVLILFDDLGLYDLGCYGNSAIQTPHINQLATEGLRFSQAYAPAPSCAPTRWSLMTGLPVGRSSTLTNNSILQPGQETVAGLLKEAGYTTGITGKWGINNDPGDPVLLPAQVGFDYFFGSRTHGEAAYSYPSYLWQGNATFPLSPGTYAPDLYAAEAVEFIGNATRPFFLYLPLTIPHANNETHSYETPTDAPYTGQPWPQVEKNYAALITRADGYIGQIRQALEVAGVTDNTLVIVTSDNGATAGGGHQLDFFAPYPLRGQKHAVYEGGIRIPLVVWGPGITPGVEDGPAWLVNFSKVALSGNPLDFIEPGPMYWGSYAGQQVAEAVRLGSLKGVRTAGGWELYDLATDPGETANLAGQQPEAVELMRQIMDAYCPAPKVCRMFFPGINK